jgi:hypothetical protein
MKINYLPKLFIILLFTFLQGKSLAQIAINATGTPPASNAMLDISSTTKGLLIPRMTTAQRTALAHTKGLTVFDITTNTYWFSDGTVWISMATVSATSPWVTSGLNIYNGNTGNVGIGTPTPTEKLSVFTASGVANFGITHSNSTVTVGTYLNFNNGQFGTKTNHPLQFFTNSGSAQITLLQNGNFGIGTNAPDHKLDVLYNPNVESGLQVQSTVGFSTIDIDAVNGDAGIRFYNSGAAKWLLRNTPISNDFQVFDMNTSLQRFAIEKATGKVKMNNDAQVVGLLSKGGGSFKIDHPTDPENKYLYHSFVESPDMMNIYNGNIVTDASGKVTVKLPDYFEALNMEFRYQLTAIGTFSQAIISKEVNNNTFEITTNQPNVKVSWQVTGVRHDAFANENRIKVEVEKERNEKGKYLHPEAFKLPISQSVNFQENTNEPSSSDLKLPGTKLK